MKFQAFYFTTAITFTLTNKSLALPSTSAAARLQHLLQTKQQNTSIPLPGVHDALSAKIFTDSGAKVLFLSGFGVSATRIAQPDVGLLTFTEMENTLQSVVQAAGNVPVIVDGDTGYGGAVNVRRMVRDFARAGAAAVTVEDQVFPKMCTYAAGEGVRVVSREECRDRIRAAMEARREVRENDGNDILIVARTDCRAAMGFEEALARCKMFEELGVDICYAENLQSREEYEEFRCQLKSSTVTILAQVQTGQTGQDVLSLQSIGEMNFDFALFGVTALQAYVKSLQVSASLLVNPDFMGCVKSSEQNIVSFDVLKSSIDFAGYESFQARCS